MAEFKVGDRVKVNCKDHEVSDDVHEIVRVYPASNFPFEIEDVFCGCDFFLAEELTHVHEFNNGETSMANVDFEEKLRQQELSEDNKALIERGLMNSDLTLAEAGIRAFSRYQFNQNKAEFVKAVVALDPPKPAEKA